jgi:hypothetical protein
MAFVGFVASYPDGQEMAEGGCYWDDVKDGISKLSLVHYGDKGREELASFTGHPGLRFYFANEVLSWVGGPGRLVAKIIGIVGEVSFVEHRLTIQPDGKTNVSTRDLPVSQLEASELSMRNSS